MNKLKFVLLLLSATLAARHCDCKISEQMHGLMVKKIKDRTNEMMSIIDSMFPPNNDSKQLTEARRANRELNTTSVNFANDIRTLRSYEECMTKITDVRDQNRDEYAVLQTKYDRVSPNIDKLCSNESRRTRDLTNDGVCDIITRSRSERGIKLPTWKKKIPKSKLPELTANYTAN